LRRRAPEGSGRGLTAAAALDPALAAPLFLTGPAALGRGPKRSRHPGARRLRERRL